MADEVTSRKEEYRKARRRGYMMLSVVVLAIVAMMLFGGHIGQRLTRIIGLTVLLLILRGGFLILINSVKLIHLADAEKEAQ